MEPPDFLKNASQHGSGLENIDSVDLVEGILPHFSFEFQLQAIRAILRDGKASRSRLKLEFDKLHQKSDKQHGLGERDLEYYGELFYEAMYREAGDSLVLSALMAAFLETFFDLLFAEIHKRFSPVLKNGKWQPKKDGGAVARAVGNAKAIQLSMPASFEKIYGALAAYRNAAMHNSLDWHESELKKFAGKIKVEGWKEDWFSIAKSGDKPTMYTLTDLFADELMMATLDLQVAVGKFLETVIDGGKARISAAS